MSDHLIAEANRHAMVLPTTQPTHADIAWYVREVYELRAELELLREWQREVIQNANAHHAEREDAIARAERAEADLATERARLDWFANYGDTCWHDQTMGVLRGEDGAEFYADSFRAAIDAAMKEETK